MNHKVHHKGSKNFQLLIISLSFSLFFQAVRKETKMVLLTNKYQYHNLMLENFLDEWVTKKRPDVVLHSNDGHNFKVHKEIFGQTQFMRNILMSAKSIHCQCGRIQISLPCSKRMVEHLVEFLYMGVIRLDVYNEAKLCEIFDNLHKILGYEPDMRRDCEEGSTSEYDSNDSIDPSEFAVNRPTSSDNESDPGTYEEQRIKNIAARKAKFDELQLKDFKEAACDKNEAKNISLLYNLPGPSLAAARPSRPRKRAAVHEGKKQPKRDQCPPKVPSYLDLYSSSSSDERGAGAVSSPKPKSAKKVEKPFKCTICGMSKSFASKLKEHIRRVHDGEKPYKCTLCDACFADKVPKSHMLSVHGEGNRVKCDSCDSTFITVADKNKHVKYAHQGIRFKCDSCDMSFTMKSSMYQHARSAHQGIRHKCDSCESTFGSKQNLKRHVKSAHPHTLE